MRVFHAHCFIQPHGNTSFVTDFFLTALLENAEVCWQCSCRARFKPDGTRWRTGGEVKAKQASGVGSQY